MRRRVRSLILLLSALAYAFLGAGPSLWALGLAPAPAKGGAACGMRLCTMKHKAGEVCLCFLRPELLRNADGSCTMRSAGCGHERGDGGPSLTPQQEHLRPLASRLELPASLASGFAPVFAARLEFVPSPLERPPQA